MLLGSLRILLLIGVSVAAPVEGQAVVEPAEAVVLDLFANLLFAELFVLAVRRWFDRSRELFALSFIDSVVAQRKRVVLVESYSFETGQV